MIIPAMQSLPIPSGTNPWLIRLLTFLLAALAAASALFWVLKWPDPSNPARSTLVATQAPAIDSDKIAQLLGASQALAEDGTPATNQQTNYKLLGVIAQGSHGSQGSALIAVEGSLAKPYRVGDTVADDLVLQSVRARSAVLRRAGQTDGALTLELPPLPGMPVGQ